MPVGPTWRKSGHEAGNTGAQRYIVLLTEAWAVLMVLC